MFSDMWKLLHFWVLFTDAEKIKDQISYNVNSSNKFQRKQNSTLNDATSILSHFLIQPYIILSIVTV